MHLYVKNMVCDRWIAPKPFKWDYSIFGRHNIHVPDPAEVIEMLSAKQQGADEGLNRWTINGSAFDMASMAIPFHHQRCCYAR